jgi:hypothetical protein
LIAHNDLPGMFFIPGKNVQSNPARKQVVGHVCDIFFRQEARYAMRVEFGPGNICLDNRLKPLQHNDVHSTSKLAKMERSVRKAVSRGKISFANL